GVTLWHISGLDNYSIPRPLYLKGGSEPGVNGNTTGSGLGGDFLGSDAGQPTMAERPSPAAARL
ncbi:MAG: hypothetical protein WAL56_11555, partial [Candidatus Sulfotelmatobacter sp.]